ncbi:hypothetical protein ONZ45_g6965 [Pleurotus djamor]|nr:hypothetical protein ONZ45_g6965 [Pleurotus djamor]
MSQCSEYRGNLDCDTFSNPPFSAEPDVRDWDDYARFVTDIDSWGVEGDYVIPNTPLVDLMSQTRLAHPISPSSESMYGTFGSQTSFCGFSSESEYADQGSFDHYAEVDGGNAPRLPQHIQEIGNSAYLSPTTPAQQGGSRKDHERHTHSVQAALQHGETQGNP